MAMLELAAKPYAEELGGADMRPGLYITSLSDSLFKSLFRILFRYDIFISYARGDGKEYAVKLRDQLKQLDFSCFLDFDELPAGNSLNNTLKRAIKKSATLVVVGTERAVKSRYVELEVGEFAGTGRAIIPIDIEGTLVPTPWRVIKERDIVWIDEVKAALAKGVPSPNVADSIDKLFKYTRRNSRVRAQVLSTIVLFVVVVVAALFMIRQQVNAATLASAKAERETIEAGKQKVLADAASVEADKQKKAADRALNNAKIAEGRAEIASNKAMIAEKAASDSAREAKRQEQIALTNAQKARAEQAKAEERTRYVLAQQVGVQADMGIGKGDLEQSVLLSVESLKTALTPEGYIAWNRGMSLLPQRVEMNYGHDYHNVSAMAYSSDGRLFAIGSSDGAVTLFQANNPSEPVKLFSLPYKEPVNVIAFGGDGSWIAAATTTGPEMKTRGQIGMWDLLTLKPIDLVNQGRFGGESIAFSPRGRYAAIATRSYIPHVFDITQGTAVAMPMVAQYVMGVAFSADGRWLAAGCSGKIVVWDVTSFDGGTEANHAPVASIDAGGNFTLITFSAEGNYLAAGNSSGGVGIWRVTHNDESLQLSAVSQWPKISREGHGLSPLVFSPDESTIATALDDNTARIWDVNTGREISRIGYGKTIDAIVFSPDGQLLATATGDITFWKAHFGVQPLSLSYDDTMQALAMSPGGEWLVTTGNASARVFRTSDWSPVITLEQAINVSKLTFTSDGRWLVVASENKVIVFDTSHWKVTKTITIQDRVSELGFSPDGRWLLVIAGSVVERLENGSWREAPAMKQSDPVTEILFSPRGPWLAARSEGRFHRDSEGPSRVFDDRKRTYVWNTNDGLLVACRTEEDTYSQYADDEAKISIARGDICSGVKGDKQEALFSEVQNWKEPLKFGVTSNASQDGRWLAAQDAGVALSIKQGNTVRPVATLMQNDVEDFIFTPDSRWLVVAGYHSVTVWPLKAADMIDAACRRLRRHDLTLDEWKQYFSGEKLQPTCVPTQQ
jgi:WD40 repeat protein